MNECLFNVCNCIMYISIIFLKRSINMNKNYKLILDY